MTIPQQQPTSQRLTRRAGRRCSQNHIQLVVIDSVPLFFGDRDGNYYPLLRVLHQCTPLASPASLQRFEVAHWPRPSSPRLSRAQSCLCLPCRRQEILAVATQTLTGTPPLGGAHQIP